MISPIRFGCAQPVQFAGAKSPAQKKLEEYRQALSGKAVNVLVRNEFSYRSAGTNVMQLPRDAAYEQVIFTVEGDDKLYVLEAVMDQRAYNGQSPVKKLYQARIGTTQPPREGTIAKYTNTNIPHVNKSIQLDRMFRKDTVAIFDGKAYQNQQTLSDLETLLRELITSTKTPTIPEVVDRYEALVRTGKANVLGTTTEEHKWGSLVTAYLQFPKSARPQDVYRLSYSLLKKENTPAFVSIDRAIDPSHYEDTDPNSQHYGSGLSVTRDHVYDFEDREASPEKVATSGEFGGRGYWWRTNLNDVKANGDYEAVLTNRRAEAALKTLVAVVEDQRGKQA